MGKLGVAAKKFASISRWLSKYNKDVLQSNILRQVVTGKSGATFSRAWANSGRLTPEPPVQKPGVEQYHWHCNQRKQKYACTSQV
jgi:hypothetical protein